MSLVTSESSFQHCSVSVFQFGFLLVETRTCLVGLAQRKETHEKINLRSRLSVSWSNIIGSQSVDEQSESVFGLAAARRGSDANARRFFAVASAQCPIEWCDPDRFYRRNYRVDG